MLDFDGVLNAFDRSGFLLRTWSEAESASGLLRSRVQLVSGLVESVDASIVLSTSWREFEPVAQLRQLLGEHGLARPSRVIGATPQLRTRGEEIRTWLDAHGRAARVAVLDDNVHGRFDMGVMRPWVVQTNPARGVTPREIECARALLTHGPVWEPTEIDGNDRRTIMRPKLTMGTFTILDRVRAQTRLALDVVETPRGWTVTDRTHLRFAATYRTRREAEAAAALAMARRRR